MPLWPEPGGSGFFSSVAVAAVAAVAVALAGGRGMGWCVLLRRSGQLEKKAVVFGRPGSFEDFQEQKSPTFEVGLFFFLGWLTPSFRNAQASFLSC